MKAKPAAGGRIRFYCPGCDKNHVVPVDAAFNEKTWVFNNGRRDIFSALKLISLKMLCFLLK